MLHCNCAEFYKNAIQHTFMYEQPGPGINKLDLEKKTVLYTM